MVGPGADFCKNPANFLQEICVARVVPSVLQKPAAGFFGDGLPHLDSGQFGHRRFAFRLIGQARQVRPLCGRPLLSKGI